MAKKIGEIVKLLDDLAPHSTAENWDNVGLLAGDPEWKTSGAVISVDLSTEVIEQARRKKFKLIVNHHPAIFPKSKGLARITPPSLIFEALRQGIAVVASHTNFDQCALEVVERVSKGLGVVPRGRLIEQAGHGPGPLVKLVVFTPESHVEAVRDALCDAGAGHVGNYDFCTFGGVGEGTFRGNEGTNPFLGKAGQLERAREVRLETVFPRGLQRKVLASLFESHPYEEVAFDLIPLEQTPNSLGIIKGLGYGFWGEFEEKGKPFADLAKGVKRLFGVDGFWLTDPKLARKRIKKVAFVAGKGSSFLDAALAQGCDLFITGEAGYHTALRGARREMAVIELGHRHSEKFFAETMGAWLKKAGLQTVLMNDKEHDLQVII